ncbi:hypothetical protein [Mycobacterium asiaticum]|uniref:hypothetical protein n=1 Tax=Mycobacterium asiaticum TaxID=1790 RepID=UPI000AF7285D|nr:hypothetical protein [Mycobacterium asiaticum]
MNDSRRFPWLSGLIAASVVAVWLLVAVINGVLTLADTEGSTGEIYGAGEVLELPP